jgi:hypothetical protein
VPEINKPKRSENLDGINFGTRECLICYNEIDARKFGSHVLSHDPTLIQINWPGGIDGVLNSLQMSLEQSIEAAKGHPRVQANLRFSLSGIEQLRRRIT